MGKLKELLPETFSYEIICDRGFAGSRMFNLCNQLEWEQVIRINGSYKLKNSGGQEHLCDDGSYRDVILCKVIRWIF